ncbi:MAG: hypothetical protein NTU73_01355 [Ignavibacteriae bacterium]|nr:hypothetical protein [Ignavibacteriota bacterium]
MVPKILDILRIISVSAAFFFGYLIGYKDGFNPQAQLHFMIPIIIAAIAGLSGIEGLFFGKQSAEAKGFEVGSNYQRQSAIALLSYAIVAVLVYIFNWGIIAELTIFFAFMFFLIFSGLNHLVDAIKRKNYKWQNINRPIITLLLIAGMIYPVIAVLKILR